MAWLGPAIGSSAFEVGEDVRHAFMAGNAATAAAFTPHPSLLTPHVPKYLADLYLLARLRLQSLGITRIYGGGECTFSDPQRYFSYRRNGVTGRMGSFIWLA
jgi:copper oxidase (laccase) domain-containing protein